MEKNKILPAVFSLLCFSLFSVVTTSATSYSAQVSNSSDQSILAGAGKSAISFPDEVFPLTEGYSGVHDDPYADVVLMESGGVRYVISSVELVTFSNVETYKEIINEVTGTPLENIVVHNPHVQSTPHFPQDTTSDQYQAFLTAVTDAVYEASQEALATLRDARFGYATGYTDINVNNVLETADGFVNGTNEGGPTDRSMSVLRFNDLQDDTIAILYVINTEAGVLENSTLADGTRLVSGDIASASEAYIEAQYQEDTVAIYCSGAGGDQWEIYRAVIDTLDAEGHLVKTDLQEDGFILLDVLARRLASQVVKAAETIEFEDVGKIEIENKVYTIPGLTVDKITDTYWEYSQEGETTTSATIFSLDDTAIVFAAPECTCRLASYIKRNSPFANTVFVGFTHYQNDTTVSYMADEWMFEKFTYQTQKSGYYIGEAEKYAEDIVERLNTLHGTWHHGGSHR